ncbi:hypothetical protein NUACC21_64930 [Scytonema sp. NUACC21]
MSVSFFAKSSTSENTEHFIPVSTEEIFEEYWQPACSKLGLKWIPLFQTGLPLEVEDISSVIQELKQLKQFFLNPSEFNIPENIKEYVIMRIQNLINELHKIQETPFVEAYIG